MKDLTAPTLSSTYLSTSTYTTTDDEGLPSSYDASLIQKHWDKEKGALNERWREFVTATAPFLTRLTTLLITKGAGKMEDDIPSLARDARIILQRLGPTFVKAGQMMSVRPDVLPDAALTELAILQDEVEGFDTAVAIAQIEAAMGKPLGEVFTEISNTPVAAASLAQVYKATLKSTNETVAVKVQRPSVLSLVSKDLYVLRRAAEVYQGLVDRFAPQQRTDYVALVSEFAVGFYTEMDFVNEGKNQERLRELLESEGVGGVKVPRVYGEISSRRVLVTEWVDGVKLSQCPPEEIKELTPIAQEAFLVQLLSVGFFHADPHPGNILRLNDPGPDGERIALIDCGLMASIKSEDRDIMISAIIHLANRDYGALVGDFIDLEILPADCDRKKVVPLMDKALSPYIKGGGAKTYEAEIRKTYGFDDDGVGAVGGFQAMTQDALTVLNDIPFSVPAYFAILGRAIITLEGVALTGDPGYGIIMESYPFIARRLLKEDRPVLQRALQELLYADDGGGMKVSRLVALVSNAAGMEGGLEGEGVINLDASLEGIDARGAIKYVMGDSGVSLRGMLEEEGVNVLDLVFRNIVRKGLGEAEVAGPALPRLPFGIPLPLPIRAPRLADLRVPIVLPGLRVEVMKVADFVDIVAPELTREEELYALSLGDVASEFASGDIEALVRGDNVLSVKMIQVVVDLFTKGGLARNMNLGGVDGAAVESAAMQVESLLEGSIGKGQLQKTMNDLVGELDDRERLVFDEYIKSLVAGVVDRVERRALSKVEVAGTTASTTARTSI